MDSLVLTVLQDALQPIGHSRTMKKNLLQNAKRERCSSKIFFPFNAPCKLKITHTRCNLSVFLWQDMTSINTYTLGNKEYLMATY